jgi:hypothetical protein
MSFQQKNITVTLVNFTLILVYFSFSVLKMLQDGSFTAANVFRVWWIVIALAVGVTIFATILTHIVLAVIAAIRTRQEPVVEDIRDERDNSIDLRGTQVTNVTHSLGAFLAMLTFVFGQPPLVMFTLLILSGVVAQIVGDATRLILYRRGF